MKRALFTALLSLVLSSATMAQDLGLKSITPRVAILLPESGFSTGFSIGAKADMGTVFNDLTLNPIISYWSSSLDFFFTTIDLDVSVIQLGADLHYDLPSVGNVYVGGGLSLNFLSIDYPSSVPFDASSTDIGFSFLGGYKLDLGNSQGVVEARYTISDLDAFEIGFSYLFDMNK